MSTDTQADPEAVTQTTRPRWGVMLVSYPGHGEMNMWCDRGDFDGSPAISVYTKERAYEVRASYEKRNPRGYYDVREVPADLPVHLISSQCPED